MQTILLGVIFFCVPGMWNAITSMAGGLDSPSMAGAATAAAEVWGVKIRVYWRTKQKNQKSRLFQAG